MVVHEPAGLNRGARLHGRSTPRAVKTVDRPREEWIAIPVPAIISRADLRPGRTTPGRQQALRLPQQQGPLPAAGPGRVRRPAATATTAPRTRTTNKKIYYYRCLGSDDYRYQGGRVCANKPVRADYLDTVVWDHITALLADPHLIRAEIDKRLDTARTADPATRQRTRLEPALAKTTTAITRMIEAFQEQLITIDELRARMPDLRARETNLRNQIQALDAQLADRDAYLKLADDLEGFLAQLRTQRRHRRPSPNANASCGCWSKTSSSAPRRSPSGTASPSANAPQRQPTDTDTEGDHSADCPLRWGRHDADPCGECPQPSAHAPHQPTLLPAAN